MELREEEGKYWNAVILKKKVWKFEILGMDGKYFWWFQFMSPAISYSTVIICIFRIFIQLLFLMKIMINIRNTDGLSDLLQRWVLELVPRELKTVPSPPLPLVTRLEVVTGPVFVLLNWETSDQDRSHFSNVEMRGNSCFLDCFILVFRDYIILFT